jgi:2-haloacid dehalogenase
MNVVFDVGNVLLRWDPRFLFTEFFDSEADMEWFLANVCSNDWNLEQDRGRSFADGVIELTKEFPEHAEAIKAYDVRWHETLPHAIDGSVDILEALHDKGAALYAITNFNSDKYRETKLRFPFLNLFRDTVVSGDERLIKPDAAIYELLLKRNGLAAAQSIFIDDSLKNVEGARAVGMKAHHFVSPQGLKKELQDLGLI